MITILRQAHAAVQDARSRGQPAVGADLLTGLRDQYDEAVALAITVNRLRDWDGDGNHPGCALGCWLRDHADQVWLFTTGFAVEWTSNSAERASKDPNGTRPSPGTGHPGHARPLVPHPQLPRIGCRSRTHRGRRHQHRAGRQALAASCPPRPHRNCLNGVCRER